MVYAILSFMTACAEMYYFLLLRLSFTCLLQNNELISMALKRNTVLSFVVGYFDWVVFAVDCFLS